MTPEDQDWVLRLQTGLAALVTVFLSKEIITSREFEQAMALVISELDQQMAAEEERIIEESPGLDLMGEKT